jgi:hypothetical protein
LLECISANESAIRLRSEGKFVSARDQTLMCASPSCPTVIRDVCVQRIATLDATAPTIVFEVKGADGLELTDVMVTMDGRPLAERLDGSAIVVDPGDHVFTFAAAGQSSLVEHVLVSPRDKGRRESVVLGRASTARSEPDAPSARPGHLGDTPKPPGLGLQRALGLTLGGVGIAAIGVGSVFGALTFSAWSSAKNACGASGTSNCPASNSATATSDRNSAETEGTISTIAFIAGGLLVASGVTLFLVRGHGSSRVAVVPAVSPTATGLAFTGAF